MRQLLATAFLLVVGVGCTRYYRVTEPSGAGTVYYTTQVDTMGTGSVRFTDMRSGSKVTLPASDVKEIKEADLPAELKPKK